MTILKRSGNFLCYLFSILIICNVCYGMEYHKETPEEKKAQAKATQARSKATQAQKSLETAKKQEQQGSIGFKIKSFFTGGVKSAEAKATTAEKKAAEAEGKLAGIKAKFSPAQPAPAQPAPAQIAPPPAVFTQYQKENTPGFYPKPASSQSPTFVPTRTQGPAQFGPKSPTDIPTALRATPAKPVQEAASESQRKLEQETQQKATRLKERATALLAKQRTMNPIEARKNIDSITEFLKTNPDHADAKELKAQRYLLNMNAVDVARSQLLNGDIRGANAVSKAVEIIKVLSYLQVDATDDYRKTPGADPQKAQEKINATITALKQDLDACLAYARTQLPAAIAEDSSKAGDAWKKTVVDQFKAITQIEENLKSLEEEQKNLKASSDEPDFKSRTGDIGPETEADKKNIELLAQINALNRVHELVLRGEIDANPKTIEAQRISLSFTRERAEATLKEIEAKSEIKVISEAQASGEPTREQEMATKKVETLKDQLEEIQEKEKALETLKALSEEAPKTALKEKDSPKTSAKKPKPPKPTGMSPKKKKEAEKAPNPRMTLDVG